VIEEILRRLERVPPKMLKNVLNGIIWEGTPDSPVAALTFDDGPDPVVTPAVLDTLDELGIRATFFLVGKRAALYPDIAREIAARGHLVANHTMTHSKLFLAGKDEVEREIGEAQDTIAAVTGTRPEWFRPPHGLFDTTCARTVKEKGLSMVLWTVLSGDYSDDPPEKIEETFEPFIRPGSIIVFHDTPEGGGGDLPRLIRKAAATARERNVRLGRIDELSLSGELVMEDGDDE